jgi:uncharacterized membrane protein
MLNIPKAPDVDIRFARRIYRLILISSLVWLSLIILPALLMQFGGMFEKISFYLYFAFSPLCHQEEARSFSIAGSQLAVCSRCSMIYAGFAAGVLAYPVFRRITNINSPPIWLLIVPAILLVLDVVIDNAGIFRNSFVTRSVTGFAVGFALTFFLIPGFIRFFFELTSFFGNKAGARF